MFILCGKNHVKFLVAASGNRYFATSTIGIKVTQATNAEKLIPIKWAHLSGVNYNTIGDSGEEFLRNLSKDAKVKVKSTVNPMGFDFDHISDFGHIDDDFIEKQKSIKDSYIKMGVEPTFSCTPYDIYDLPEKDTQVSFAESNAAIFANSIGKLKTNKEIL